MSWQKKIISLFFLYFVFIVAAKAQVSQAYLDINNIRARINSFGTLFMDTLNQKAGFEVPKGSNRFTIFSSALWIGGLGEDANLHLAAQTSHERGDDYWPGPLHLSDAHPADPSQWDKVYKVNKKTIDAHIDQWSDDGYTVPNELLQWPGNGPQGYSKVLAPFADFNDNKLYEPKLGEFPVIEGDQAIYFLFNDNAVHEQSKGVPLEIEIHGMAFAYNKPELQNVIFVTYYIFNRSPMRYKETYLGVFTDFDLGYPFDDYIGTDSLRNMYYVYNGDNFDDFPGQGGYGSNPPAQALIFLNKKLDRTISYSNDTSISGDPVIGEHFYRYLKGEWKDGSKAPKYAYPGNPCDSSGETETAKPFDRRIIGSFGPFDFRSGDIISLKLAYVFAQGNKPGTKNPQIQSFCELQKKADEVIQFYKKNLAGTKPLQSINRLTLYPNPVTNDFLTIKLTNMPAEKTRIKIYDIQGKEIIPKSITPQNNQELQIKLPENISTGLYSILAYSGRMTVSKTFLVK